MPPAASRSCPCTTPSPTAATSSPSPATDTGRARRRGPAARVGIRAAARSASTPWAAWSPTASRTPPPTGPGSWPGGPATPRPTSAWPPATASTSWTSTAPPAPRPSGPWPPPMAWQSSGPLVRTGGGGWHYYLAPTGLGNAHPADLEHVDWRGRGGYVVAPPSRHASGHPYQWVAGRDLDTPPGRGPRGAAASGCSPASSSGQPARSSSRPPATARVTAMRGRPWPRSWPGSPPPRSASATASCGSRPATSTTWSPPAPSTTARSTRGSWQAAERCGLLAEEPRQTRRTLASGRQVGLAHPGRPRQPTSPERTHASPTPPARAAGERAKEREVKAMAAAGHPAG